MLTARPSVVVAAIGLACGALLAIGCGRQTDLDTPSVEKAEPPRQVTPAATTRPNVVLIIVDTLRADKLSCYGFDQETSPELDALAAQGVQFVRTVAQCSWTRPSIASMITSRYPRSLGLYDEKDEILSDDFATLAEVLQSHGYNTLGITANPVINSVFNMHQGFDTHIDSNVLFSWMQPEEGKITARNNRLNSAKEIFDVVLDRVRDRSSAPWFVQINIMEMHEYWRRTHHLTRPEFHQLFSGMRNQRYLQALRQVSVDIDAFVKALTALPGWENTLFVITSDHGQGLDDHPSVPNSGAHGRTLYESVVMVPLIFYHPNAAFGTQRITRPVRLLDVMPTVLDYLDVPVTELMDGTSLLPLVQNPEGTLDLPDQFITETEFREFNKIGVYAAEWKYIENRDGHPQLNARELQPMGIVENGKRTDQIDAQPDVADSLRRVLEAWEARYPKVPATPRIEGISEEEMDQLKAIGYLQ